MAPLSTPNPEPLRQSELRVHPVALWMVRRMIRLCPDEVGSFGYVTRVGPRLFELRAPDDVLVCDQVVTAFSVTYDPVGFGKLRYNSVKAGREEQLLLQLHSHPGRGRNGAYFSATDMADIEAGADAGAPWWVSLVFDSTGQYCVARVDMFDPIRAYCPLQVVPLPIEGSVDTRGLDRRCRELLEAHVTRRVAVSRGKNPQTVDIGVFDELPARAVTVRRRKS